MAFEQFEKGQVNCFLNQYNLKKNRCKVHISKNRGEKQNKKIGSRELRLQEYEKYSRVDRVRLGNSDKIKIGGQINQCSIQLAEDFQEHQETQQLSVRNKSYFMTINTKTLIEFMCVPPNRTCFIGIRLD